MRHGSQYLDYEWQTKPGTSRRGWKCPRRKLVTTAISACAAIPCVRITVTSKQRICQSNETLLSKPICLVLCGDCVRLVSLAVLSRTAADELRVSVSSQFPELATLSRNDGHCPRRHRCAQLVACPSLETTNCIPGGEEAHRKRPKCIAPCCFPAGAMTRTRLELYTSR